MDDRCPSKDPFVKGRLRNDPQAVGIIVPGLGIIFISSTGVALATDREIRDGR